MKLFNAVALSAVAGKPGLFTSIPPPVTSISVEWPVGAPDNIGIVAFTGQIHVIANEDTNIHKISMTFERASDGSLLGVVVLAKHGPGAAQDNPNKLRGFAETRSAPASEIFGPEQAYLPVSKVQGLRVLVSVLGKSSHFEQDRFDGSFALEFTYIHLNVLGEPVSAPLAISQLELLNAQAGNAQVLALQNDGSLRMATIVLATGAATWQPISTE